MQRSLVDDVVRCMSMHEHVDGTLKVRGRRVCVCVCGKKGDE